MGSRKQAERRKQQACCRVCGEDQAPAQTVPSASTWAETEEKHPECPRTDQGEEQGTPEPRKRKLVRISTASPLSAFAKHFGEEEVKFNRSISKVTIDIYNYLLTTSLLNCVAFSHSQLSLSCSHGIWSLKPIKTFCKYNRTILGKILVLRASQRGG